MSQPSLRDAKRTATSAGLALAALRLAEERGLDAFTIDDIVNSAGYSRRTFANHFAGKEDAVVAAAFVGFEDLDTLVAQLPERMHLTLLVRAVEEWPAALPANAVSAAGADHGGELTPAEVIDALERIVLSPIIVGMLRAGERLAPLVDAHPTLLPALLARKNAMGESINRLIARIDGIDMTQPYVPILLGALIGALGAFDQIPRNLCAVAPSGEPLDQREHIRLIFEYLRHGFAGDISRESATGEAHPATGPTSH